MNHTCKQVLLHFLKQYLKELSFRKTASRHPYFDSFFLKEELITIIKSMSGSITLEEIDLENLTSEELLLIIDDDRYIIDFFLKQWNRNAEDRLTPIAVWNTLEQLSLPTHYLASKAIIDWDEYDFSNYKSLQIKAGKLKRVYGIYDAYVKPEEALKIDSPPKRFFENYDQAQKALDELVSNKNFSEQELQIIPLYITL